MINFKKKIRTRTNSRSMAECIRGMDREKDFTKRNSRRRESCQRNGWACEEITRKMAEGTDIIKKLTKRVEDVQQQKQWNGLEHIGTQKNV